MVLTISDVLHELVVTFPLDVGTQVTESMVVVVGDNVETLSLSEVDTLSVVNVENWVAVGSVTHDMVARA